MALGFTSITGVKKVVDITSSGCREHHLKKFRRKYNIVEIVDLPGDILYKDFMRWYEANDGKDYDNLQIIGILLKCIGFFSFNTIGHNFKKLICSELILSYLINKYRIKVKDSDNYDLIGTSELIEKIKEENG
jgi:hypothetical protein